MNTIKTNCGCLVNTDHIIEIRPKGDQFIVVTAAGRYAVSAEAVAQITKPTRRVTKAKT